MSQCNFNIPGNRKILLVEDVEMNQFLASRKMESWGVHVDIAQNGRVALEMVKKGVYDLILMDIQMPEMDGLEATMHIRNMPDASKACVPIVALTANILNGDGERYIAAGMNGFICKPFDDRKLFDIITLNLKNGSMSAEPLNATKKQPVAAKPEPSEKLYDLGMVESIAGGDTAFVNKMVQIFLDTMPPTAVQLNEALQNKDWDALSKLAHKMKSTIDSMGIVRLREVIRTIEANGKSRTDLEGLPALVKRVDEVLSECFAQLREDFE